MSSTSLPNQTLSSLVHYMKYARYVEQWGRRELFTETVARNANMHIQKYPWLRKDILEAYQLVYDRHILPSMRSMQFAGQAMFLNNCRMYNCSYTPIDNPEVFREVMFLLLSGCGVGYSVQRHHVAKLPPIRQPLKCYNFTVPDSIAGWAQAIDMLIQAFFTGSPLPVFDFSLIRPKGSPLRTSGGSAPGPEPLKKALTLLQLLLMDVPDGQQLRPIDCHDILCHMADCVLAGGIRRSSYIALFSLDDQHMMDSKQGEWWKNNPQRALANNSVVVKRQDLTEKTFWKLWEVLVNSGAGEPNIFQTNDYDIGVNPCGEVSLKGHQFCNLVEINASNIQNQQDLNYRARLAARLATLQATFTNPFPQLRPVWRENTERDGLIGVGMTGIAAGRVLGLNMAEAVEHIKDENRLLSQKLGISQAKRLTTVKPSGTSSLLLSNGMLCSSGVHAYHAAYYLRRIVVTHSEPMYQFLRETHPHLLEPSAYRPEVESVITVPLKAPSGAITRDEGAFALLERVKRLYNEWVLPGHLEGANTNNVSTTIPVKEGEWDAVGKWWWENRQHFVSVTCLPHDGGNYKQMPFEACDAQTYEQLASKFTNLDLSALKETGDNTCLKKAVACSGGSCELTAF